MNIERPKSVFPIPEHAQCVFKGQLFDVYQWEQEMYDGIKKVFEKIKRPDSVVVFPVLPDGRILLTKQSQPGRDEFIDAPSGIMDKPGESVFDVARRELLEETGYTAENYILWKAEYITTKIDWVVYTFIAKNVVKVSDQNLDNGEKIQEYIVTFDELLELTDNTIFRAKETVPDLLRAKTSEQKYKELQELFSVK